jgi:hypothetical protein
MADKKLSDAVEISRTFLRSIRIDVDFGREDGLSGYVCQGTARNLLEAMSHQILETRQRAFTWTGPYGGGKSSLALMLCSLVGPDLKLRNKAKQILSLPDDSPVYKAFSSKADGWTVIPVVGKRANIKKELIGSIDKYTGQNLIKNKSADVIEELIKISESTKRGLLLVIDELGKFLESSALDGGEDIYFFQELAEAASRSAGKFIVVGILHQPFDAYATRLGRQARDDWAKVQGRYIDIPLVSATDEVLELIGRSIKVEPSPPLTEAKKICETIADNIKARRPITPPEIAKSLLACWPLHPITSSLLGPISRRKFGQNERSVFGFLASREPLSFMDFMHEHPLLWSSMYRPTNLWDYLKANLEPAILASTDGHRWSQAVDSIERAEAKGTPLHIEVMKSIALIEMFRNGAHLAADDTTIMSCLVDTSEKEFKAVVKDLILWKVIIERKHLGAYGIYAGSDFDIESAINQSRTEIGSFNNKLISDLSDLHPIIAKRHYQEKGTMRWFSRSITPISELEVKLATFGPIKGSVGSFILCLPDDINVSEKEAVKTVGSLAKKYSELRIVLGIPTNASIISEMSMELAAAEYVFSSRTELEGDSVARREISSRISSLRLTLQEELTEAFRYATWYFSGSKLPGTEVKTLSNIASTIADDLYPDAPNIFSELLNRDELSSNIVKARKLLMYKMIKDEHLPKLGYEGYPSDAGLYYSVLNNSGLHSKRGPKGWAFGAPPEDYDMGSSFRSIWLLTDDLVKNSKIDITLEELYKNWFEKFGLKKGVAPVLALAYFLANKTHIALYLNEMFTSEISEVFIDEFLLDPKSIRFKYVSTTGTKSGLAKAITSQVLGGVSQDEKSGGALNAARGLVTLVYSLPNWSKRTSTVSQIAQEVRAMLLKANDPHKVLFADLPTLLKTENQAALVDQLKTIIDELTSAYPKMLKEVLSFVLSSLNHTEKNIKTLKLRASSIKGITGDTPLDAFATRIEQLDDSIESIGSLISLAVSKPEHSWVDRDIDAAKVRLASFALDFRKAEAVAPLRGRQVSRRYLNIVMGAGEGKDIINSVEVSEADSHKINEIIGKILPTLENEKSEFVLAALAELGVRFSNNSLKKEIA